MRGRHHELGVKSSAPAYISPGNEPWFRGELGRMFPEGNISDDELSDASLYLAGHPDLSVVRGSDGVWRSRPNWVEQLVYDVEQEENDETPPPTRRRPHTVQVQVLVPAEVMRAGQDIRP